MKNILAVISKDFKRVLVSRKVVNYLNLPVIISEGEPLDAVRNLCTDLKITYACSDLKLLHRNVTMKRLSLHSDIVKVYTENLYITIVDSSVTKEHPDSDFLWVDIEDILAGNLKASEDCINYLKEVLKYKEN